MNSRERVLIALNHKEPDRVPLDIGATFVTGIHRNANVRWRQVLGLPTIETRLIEIIQQIAWVEDDMIEVLGIDAKPLPAGGSLTFQLELQDRGDETFFYDEWGIGWRMPKDYGLYYDMFHHPLAGNITIEDIDKSPAPDPTNLARFKGMSERARKIVQEEKRAVVANQMTAGISEIAAWTRGYEDYYTDLASNERLIDKLLDKVAAVKRIYWERALVELGENIDVIMFGDDFAGQKTLLMSPKTWRRLIKPRYKELFDFLHSKTKAKIFLHSCGAIREIIPDLIEIGLDILNPVQVSAAGMNTSDLKREYGKDLVFWGGGVDTQDILPHGTPDQVHDEVCHRLEDLMPGGGFVFSAVHNIQADVPTENLMAMFEALCKYGRYSV